MNILKKMHLFAVLVLAGCAQDTGAPVSGDANPTADMASQTASADGTAGGESGGTEVDVPDIDALLANANAELGKRQFIFCQACHTVEAGGANKLGPNLSGIVDQEAAKVAGFVYSPALSQSGLVWDVATLDQWIANPPLWCQVLLWYLQASGMWSREPI